MAAAHYISNSFCLCTALNICTPGLHQCDTSKTPFQHKISTNTQSLLHLHLNEPTLSPSVTKVRFQYLHPSTLILESTFLLAGLRLAFTHSPIAGPNYEGLPSPSCAPSLSWNLALSSSPNLSANFHRILQAKWMEIISTFFHYTRFHIASSCSLFTWLRISSPHYTHIWIHISINTLPHIRVHTDAPRFLQT